MIIIIIIIKNTTIIVIIVFSSTAGGEDINGRNSLLCWAGLHCQVFLFSAIIPSIILFIIIIIILRCIT